MLCFERKEQIYLDIKFHFSTFVRDQIVIARILNPAQRPKNLNEFYLFHESD